MPTAADDAACAGFCALAKLFLVSVGVLPHRTNLTHQLSGDYITFQELLKEARKWNILDGATEHMAHDVGNMGNDVMHERPTDLSEALEVLTKVRGLVQHIYSAEGLF